MRYALAILIALTLLAPTLAAPAPARADDRLVFAFYYMWYLKDSWARDPTPFQPVQPYDSRDPATMRRHLTQAASARIDALIVSWWGPDPHLNTLLDLAQKESTVRISIYVEPESDRLNTRPALVANLRDLVNGTAAHPAFVRYRDRPVIFVWRPESVARAPGQSTNDAWRSIFDEVDPQRRVLWSAEGIDLGLLDVFDGLHQFGAALWAADPGASDRAFRARIDAYNRAHGTAKIWAAGTAPGHDNTRQAVPRPFYVDRAGGAYYRRNFQGAISSNPEWITIVSWNEWGEGTQIEPATAYGDLYLDITREMVDAYKGPMLDRSPAAAFRRAWARADGPVAGQSVQRAWLWGPEPFDERQEPYAEAPGGQRVVRYYDKARMEITRPGAEPAAPGYVTNGLLARELIGGEIQVSDGAFERRRPARLAVVGDANARRAVTYADLAAVAGWGGDGRAPERTGGRLAERFVPGKGVAAEEGLVGYGVDAAFYEAGLGHNLPSVFWEAFNAAGPVLDPASGQLTSGPILDWRADVGLPLMEPLWVTAVVGGEERDVLLQCFERRCLTYTPANPPEWRVEMGNVGRHYFAWRHGG